MLDRFLRPAQIKTNQDGALLRLIACFCMFIDHAGKMLFPQLTWMRLVGRLAFPLFAYGIAVGAAMTKHPQPYITRVAALALVSQPLYAVALGHTNSAMYAVPFAQHPLRALYTFYIKSWETPSILLPLPGLSPNPPDSAPPGARHASSVRFASTGPPPAPGAELRDLRSQPG